MKLFCICIASWYRFITELAFWTSLFWKLSVKLLTETQHLMKSIEKREWFEFSSCWGDISRTIKSNSPFSWYNKIQQVISNSTDTITDTTTTKHTSFIVFTYHDIDGIFRHIVPESFQSSSQFRLINESTLVIIKFLETIEPVSDVFDYGLEYIEIHSPRLGSIKNIWQITDGNEYFNPCRWLA